MEPRLSSFIFEISNKEQKRRLLARLNDPNKAWKASVADIIERKLWTKHMAAYQDMIRNTSTAHAPWYVVPADHKWFARLFIGIVIVNALESMHVDFPKLDQARLRQIKCMRKVLQAT